MPIPDFGRRSHDYARYRPGFPPSFYDRLERFGPLVGIRALDLATGPGIVALELARRGARVTGIDIAAGQIEAARRLADQESLRQKATFLLRRAEATGLDAGAFDLVTAGQCWMWFDQEATLGEVQRLLRPRGMLVIAHFCYLPRLDPIARDTEELILHHNPTWTMAGSDGLYPMQIDAVLAGGFALLEQFCYDHDQPFSHEAWRGRIRTCNGVGSGVMTDEQVDAFDTQLARMLHDRYPAEPLLIRHRVWAIVAQKK